MNMTVQRYANWLKERFYTLSYAVCANVYRRLSSLQRRLRSIDETTTCRPVQFVVIQVRIPLLKLTDLFFELAFSLGQSRLLFLERQSAVRDVHKPVLHVADRVFDKSVVASSDRCLGGIERSSTRGNSSSK